MVRPVCFRRHDDRRSLDDVVDVALEQGVRTQAGIDVMQQADVGGGEQESSSASSPSFLSTLLFFGQQRLAVLLVHRVVAVAGVLLGVFLVRLTSSGINLLLIWVYMAELCLPPDRR